MVFYGFEETIDNDFCSQQLNLTHISYRGMTSLQSVGNYWMSRCYTLITINFEGLRNLQRVGDRWLCCFNNNKFRRIA